MPPLKYYSGVLRKKLPRESVGQTFSPLGSTPSPRAKVSLDCGHGVLYVRPGVNGLSVLHMFPIYHSLFNQIFGSYF